MILTMKLDWLWPFLESIFEKFGHSDTPRAAFLNTIKNAKIIKPKEK